MRTERLEDDLEDEIGQALRRAAQIRTWTKERRDLMSKCVTLSDKAGYVSFTGDCRYYLLYRVGQHCLYDVPPGQRGALSNFVGKRVRVICVGRTVGYDGHRYMAGIAGE